MEQAVLNETVMRKYLLGELPEEEREQIEKNILTDDGFFQNLLTLEDAVEDELIDDYFNGNLTDREKKEFERIFLSTHERREKLALVRDLNTRAFSAPIRPRVGETPSQSQPWWRTLPALLRLQNPVVALSLMTALLLVMVGGVWLLLRVQHLETELSQLRAQPQNQSPPEQNLKEQLDQQRARNDDLSSSLNQAEQQRARLEQELNSLKAQNTRSPEPPGNQPPNQSQTPVFSVTLPLLRGRGTEGEGIKTVALPLGTSRIRLDLALDTINPKDYKSYQAVVKKRDDTEVWKAKRVNVTTKGAESYITLILAATILPEGEYNVELNGISGDNQNELIGMYSFRVMPR